MTERAVAFVMIFLHMLSGTCFFNSFKEQIWFSILRNFKVERGRLGRLIVDVEKSEGREKRERVRKDKV